MALNIKKFVARYVRNEAGQFAVITAMFGLPLLLITGYAIDLNKAVGKKAVLSAALDAAALASVIPDNLDDEERAAFARDVFDENYFGNLPAKLTVNATRERVDISATANMPTLISEVAGMKTMAIREKSAAIVTRSDVVCVLALDPTGDRAIEFIDQARFNSPACSVQANSTSNVAIVSDVVESPTAHTFCTAGLSQGEFLPYIKHACTPIIDPYEDLIPPVDGLCEPIKSINKAHTILSPGTYCEGLGIQSGTVEFEPGIYIIKSKRLEFKAGVIATGKGVTFVFKESADLLIAKDAQVTLQAPATGRYAGLVFYQTNETEIGKKPKLPNGTNTITSGGGLSIIGTAYFPTHELIITSDSPVISQSPATSFIAYRMKFAGQSNITVNVDHEAGGIPPLLPRSDDGARLVSTDMPVPYGDGDDDDDD